MFSTKKKTTMNFCLVGKGKIGGNWCDSFWKVNEDGTIGLYGRFPQEEKRIQILDDIRRHRKIVLETLNELELAESYLLEKTNTCKEKIC